MKIKRHQFLTQASPSHREPSIRTVQGLRGIRVLAYPFNGSEVYEGQYLHVFTREWITPFGGEYSVYLHGDIEDALKAPKEMYERIAKRITKDTIMRENNVEHRRLYMEFLGTTEYVKRMDLELVAEEKDALGKPMKLYRGKTDERSLDPSSGMRVTYRLRQSRLWFLMVTDSSTDREYYLSVKEPSKNRSGGPLLHQYDKDICSQVKASTFGNVTLWGRQGDVGIIKLKREPPVMNATYVKRADGTNFMVDDGTLTKGIISRVFEKPTNIIET